MSTTGRSRVRGSRTEPRFPRDDKPTLTGRTARVRNAFMCHAAAQLGLPVPEDADLAALAPNTTLAEAVGRWRATHAPVIPDARPAGPRWFMRTGWAIAITLLGLAFSYGSVQ